MTMIIPLAIGLVIGGLIIFWLRGSAPPLLQVPLYWLGVILVVLGLLLLFVPVAIWVRDQLVVMLGIPR